MSKHELVAKKDILPFLKKLHKCNNMDYEEIRNDIIANISKISRMKLISNGVWWDTIHIKPKKGFESFIRLLAFKWKADEIHYISNKHEFLINAKKSSDIPNRPLNDMWLRIWFD